MKPTRRAGSGAAVLISGSSMESSQEFEGRSLEEALRRAAAALGREPGNLKYEVVEGGRKGFLGVGSRPVKIRVVVARTVPAAAPDGAAADAGRPLPGGQGPQGGPGGPRGGQSQGRREWRGGGQPRTRDGGGGGRPRGREGEGQGAQSAGTRFGGSEDAVGRGGQGRRRRRGGRDRRGGQDGHEAGSRREGGGVREGRDDNIGNRRDDRGPRGGQERRGDRGDRGAQRGRVSSPLPPLPSTPSDIPYSRQEALRQVASQVLGHMKLELRAKLREREETVVLELSGHDASYFLENDGEALEGLQHILNKILARDERFGKRVVVDCEGFRSRRDEELLEKARRAADEALSTGEAVHMDGLNPYERRLIHVELAGREGIHTYSTGDGAIRRLTIEAGPGGQPAGGESPGGDDTGKP